MVIFAMLKWYKFLYYKEILSIYWMTLVPLKRVFIQIICLINASERSLLVSAGRLTRLQRHCQIVHSLCDICGSVVVNLLFF